MENGELKKNLKKLTAIQRQILQFLFIIDKSVLHVFLYFIHFQFQIISMLDELIDVEVLSVERKGYWDMVGAVVDNLLVFHVDQLRFQLGDPFSEFWYLCKFIKWEKLKKL